MFDDAKIQHFSLTFILQSLNFARINKTNIYIFQLYLTINDLYKCNLVYYCLKIQDRTMQFYTFHGLKIQFLPYFNT